VAVTATGAGYAGHVVGTDPTGVTGAGATVAVAGVTATDLTADLSPGLRDTDLGDELESRARSASRSEDRKAAVAAKRAELLDGTRSGGQVTRTEVLPEPEPPPEPLPSDPRGIAQQLLGEFGFSSDQFGCLDALWTKESGWNVYADNPTSSAYGIPQALPGSKMATAGSDWATNPATQVRWGLGYIAARYGSPCAAWVHSQANNWY
jgi:hypothetical protein